MEGQENFEGNRKQLEILLQGVEVWNGWRARRPGVLVDLKGVDLRAGALGADCALTKSPEGRGMRVDLSGIHLAGANLRKANLEHAVLHQADLQGADLSGARLEGAVLIAARLQKAYLFGVSAEGAILAAARLEGALLGGAHLERASLHDAHLDRAYLASAHLDGARLTDTKLVGADLLLTAGLLPDRTQLSQAKLDPRSRDPWSILCRAYSGPMLLLNVLLLFAFVLPWGLRGAWWGAVNSAQVQMVEQQGRASASSELTGAAASPCLAKECEQRPVWWLLLQLDRHWLSVALVVALLFYNLMRTFLTWRVGLFRDAELRTGYTPSLGRLAGRNPLRDKGVLRDFLGGYWVLYRMHQFMLVFQWVAWASVAWNAWSLLTKVVEVPA